MEYESDGVAAAYLAAAESAPTLPVAFQFHLQRNSAHRTPFVAIDTCLPFSEPLQILT